MYKHQNLENHVDPFAVRRVVVELVVLVVFLSASQQQTSREDVGPGPAAQVLFLLVKTTPSGSDKEPADR
ncbi:hypothetical protein EYF80_019704 [Liparis tanakae]|uniref:Uncharacterized protein n=1 Tax=Liparis tanakae TaxID=230148 RepID=A0A4Z2HWH0_9TELE|nr:hypothetical protein EYF80_019704 [Liparis tanakae]